MPPSASSHPTHNNAPAPAQKWLNVFQCCKFLRFLGHVMVLFVLALVGLTVYTVAVVVFAPLLSSRRAGKIIWASILLAIFSALVVMLLWSYFAAVSTDPGGVPPGWHPFLDEAHARSELERMAYSDYYFDRRDPRRPRFCKRCQSWKPERSHHCSVSGRCILKQDHYCIWVINCVGLLNYKSFLLFLAYTLIACLMSVLLLLGPVINFFNNELRGSGAPLALIAFIMDMALAAAILGFLVMHGQLIASNCTTIEMYEKDRLHPWPYNKGARKNFEEVFGRTKWRWFLPYYSQEERTHLVDTYLGQRLLSGVNPEAFFTLSSTV
ncbi:MAG: hypothetical protein WDW38_009678 [Sanguina aurantia]